MEHQKFVSLVERLEVYAREHPTAYKLRAGMLAAVGYLVLIGTVVAVLLLIAGSIYLALNGMMNIGIIQVLIVPIGAGAIVLRSLWVEFPKPEGQRLRPADAPRLFELIDRIRKATKAPKVHKVLLTEQFNASIVQRPRLGIFGWHENYLNVGLPLLHGLSPDEVRAVIAHEFGHLSRKHGAASSWIYRVRQTWIQVLVNMQKHRRYGTALFRNLFTWYVPYFSAYSWVLARATEFEADRFAVVLAGRQNAARALINIDLKDRALKDEFWPEFFRGAATEPEPPEESFSAFLEWIRKPLTGQKAQTWFAHLLTQRRHYSDSHPALADRLEAIGYCDARRLPDLDVFMKNSMQWSDEYFLQKPPTEFIAGKDREWQESFRESWNERRALIVDANKSLAALELKSRTQELTVNERLERANLVARTSGRIAMIPLLREVLALEPTHTVANFAIGDALLDQGDEAGVAHLEVAMENDPHTTPSACHSIFLFMAGRRRIEEADEYRRRAEQYQQMIDLAHEERNTITGDDEFKSHGLAPDAVVALRAHLARYPNLASARLAQKVVKYFPENPCYVLGVLRKRTWYQLPNYDLDLALINEVAKGLQFPAYVVLLDYKPLRKALSGIRGAEIYRAVS